LRCYMLFHVCTRKNMEFHDQCSERNTDVLLACLKRWRRLISNDDIQSQQDCWQLTTRKAPDPVRSDAHSQRIPYSYTEVFILDMTSWNSNFQQWSGLIVFLISFFHISSQ
jgi:hypothetical protein